MTEPSERLAGLLARPGAAAQAETVAAEGPAADLVGGARLRTQVALATLARAAAASSPARSPSRRVRWRIGTEAALAVAGLLAALGVAAAWWWWPSGEPARVVSLTQPAGASVAPGPGAPAAPGGSAASGGDGTPLVVHVVGAVAAPGVVRLPAGSRVTDAVDAAGGALPEADLAGVNLARLLADGEQILVPAQGAAGGQGPAGGQGAAGGALAGGPVGLLDLNAADAAALDALPGIGPVLAERIVTWRESHGRFTSVDELAEVTGIGPSLLAGVRELVRV